MSLPTRPPGFIVNSASGVVRQLDEAMYPPLDFASILVYWGEPLFVAASRVPPKSSGPRAHKHTVDQLFICLRGRLELRLGAQEHHLTPGKMAVIPAGVRHEHRNSQDDDELHLELIVPGIVPGQPISEYVPGDEAWSGSGSISSPPAHHGDGYRVETRSLGYAEVLGLPRTQRAFAWLMTGTVDVGADGSAREVGPFALIDLSSRPLTVAGTSTLPATLFLVLIDA